MIISIKRKEKIVAQAVAIKGDGKGAQIDDNLIALCPNCAAAYKAHHSSEDERRLLAIKARLKAATIAEEKLSNMNVDDEIAEVIETLASISMEGVPAIDRGQLSMLARKVEEKIPDDCLLMEEIRGQVTRHFRTIQDAFNDLAQKMSFDFDYLAGQMRHAYKVICATGASKEVVVDRLAAWLQDKTGASSNRACKIVVAYFVQNCEVFDAPSE